MSNKNYIKIKGASMHNLKNISLDIPKNKLVVITGVSGSGKSTLAYDTIHTEAQRRYIESLNSYARQFLKNNTKPVFEKITGLSPSIAINQKNHINNSRSTVGTTTEIYYYLTILYAHIGRIFSPVSGKEVKTHSFRDFQKYIQKLKKNTKIIIACPIKNNKIDILKNEGYTRLIYNGNLININELNDSNQKIKLVIDRLIISSKSGFEFNLNETYKKAMDIGEGECIIYNDKFELIKKFSNHLKLDNISFEKPTKNFFNFNNPYGACKKCSGHGDFIDLDKEKIIPNKELTFIENAVHPWKNGKMEKWKKDLIQKAKNINFPINKKYSKLSKEELEILWNGKSNFKGIYGFFNFLKKKSYKIQYRIMLSKYKSLSVCNECNGTRLRKEVQYVLIDNYNINDVVNMPINRLSEFIKGIDTMINSNQIIEKIKIEITARIDAMLNLGLDYLSLNRKSNSLSGGEMQKINITKSIGNGLIGSIYVLDEPSIGLHARDTGKLIGILKKLRDLGNSILVVEHDKEIIKSADHIIDIGPLAGINGGEIVYNGKNTLKNSSSFTLNYIKQNKNIQYNTISPKNFITIKGANKHNLKKIDISIPLNVFCAVTGLSGSGKTTLCKDVLLPGVKRKLKDYTFQKPKCKDIIMDTNSITNIEYLSQNSIKKSSKSTPITYIKAFDPIRALFSMQNQAKKNNFNAKYFSFNVSGGRCEKCKGQGYVNIEMQFLADITLECDNCKGFRYKRDVLKVLYCKKNIYNILNLTINEGYDFFKQNGNTNISDLMKPLIDVGLGYLKMGQSVSTLSSGEAQRLKLATFLSQKHQKAILIFDEPTKGLHFHDIDILIKAFKDLITLGNTVVVIEHNLDVIKNVDWVIDLGPDAGHNGGDIIFSGTPLNLIEQKSHTGLALKKEINF